MLLEGACHCGSVRFTLRSETPVPYMLCHCSICRKTAGGGGYAINIMGLAATLEVRGRKALSVYRAKLGDGSLSEARRHFCARCGSALWLADPRWPEWVYPFASAVDTPLPVPPQRVHIMENYRQPWCAATPGPEDDRFDEYPREAILDWHRKRGLLVPA
jgi:hypothetical protein